MSIVQPKAATHAPAPAVTAPAQSAAGRSRRALPDLLFAGVALALALWVTSSLWADPTGGASEVNSGDQALFEWLLSFGAHEFLHGGDLLFTHLLNVPDGVNLAVNTSITVYAVLFAPLTIWLGAPITFLIILTLNLAGSAFAWYWLLSRHLATSRLGAAIGGLLCGFAPAMISHANAHLNWTAQWLVPLIIVRILLLARRQRPVRDGLILGLMIAACFSIAAEALFFTALALGIFTVTWALARRERARAIAPRFLKGLGLAAAIAGALLAYPLWLHFVGPQGFHGTGFDPKVHSEDLAAYAAWPERSLAGQLGLDTSLAANPTEENSFFGLPLLVLAIAGFVALWRTATAERRTVLRALAVTGGVFVIASLGPNLRWLGHLTEIPLPGALLVKLPIFNAALPSRLALVVAPVLGLIVAWLITALPSRATQPALPGPRAAWIAGLVVALVPLLPTPLASRDREPVPHFIRSGAWESYLPDRGVLVSVPLPLDVYPDGQRWQADALARAAGDGGPVFRMPSGFFLGPGGPNGTGRIGPVPRPTAELLERVGKTGLVPPIGPADQARAREDLAYWQADLVVLADSVHGAHWPVDQAALRTAMVALLGEPERVDDVWLWRVR